MTREELENRLIRFSVDVIQLAEQLPNSRAGSHLAGQIVRSSISPSLNFGEAREAESNKDFIHKLKIILKELRETHIALKIINELQITPNKTEFEKILDENNQLIAIFVSSTKTAKNKIPQRK